jgi:hypothetical protein
MATKKCAHETCTCTAAEGSDYCSTFCKDLKGVTTLECECGHPGCSGAGKLK